MQVLDRRTLNRTTLARQWLAERQPRSAAQALVHLVGMQAQEPHEPYVGLWSRVADFAHAELSGLLTRREAVRTLMMRRTLHLMTSDDCRSLRPLHQHMLVQRMRGTLGPRMPGVDLDELAVGGARAFATGPKTLSEAARTVADRWPDVAVRDLGDALSTLLPLVQVPPRGLWGVRAPAHHTSIEAWLGDEPAPSTTLDDLVLRYLRAYGPAASADVRAWSGLTGLPAVITRLRPQLQTYRDERGRELLDAPDAELADPDLPAPPRFLPAFDNVVLGYDDRSRMIDDEHRRLSVLGTRFVLVDGRVAGSWTSTGDASSGVHVSVTLFGPLRTRDRSAVTDEAERLAGFLGDGEGGLGRVSIG